MRILLSFLALGTLSLNASPIESGQAIQITVQGVPATEAARLNGTYPVSNSGFINMWEVGDIRAAGIDSAVLAKRIAAAYREAEIYTNPTFQIISNSSDIIKQQLVTVGGKVRAPGQKPYQKGMTLFEAVAAAGGATEFGAKNRVRLYRNKKVFTYDLGRAEHKMLLVYPNDIIDVPAKNWIGQ